MARWNIISSIYNNGNSDPIPLFDGYRLTHDLKVVGKTGRLLSEVDTNKTGYRFVNVMVNGKQGILYVHRAIALVYVQGYFDGAWVDHKDDNPFNSHPSNLRWVTPLQNNRFVKGNKYSIQVIRDRIEKTEMKLKELRNKERILMMEIDG